MDIPILLLNFNRPDHTSRSIGNLRKIKPAAIYIAQDGPRRQNENDIQKCREVREILENEIDWDCEKRYLLRNENLGCMQAVSGAIDWFFEHEEFGIVMEDDCEISDQFYQFCEVLGAKYENDDSVAMIASHNPGIRTTNTDYFFSSLTMTIGWATWKKKWEEMHFSMSDFNEFVSEGKISKYTKDKQANEYMLMKWQESFENKNDSWAYRWAYHVFNRDKLCLVPNANMVRNFGVNESSATNTQFDDRGLDKLEFETLKFPLQHPLSIRRDINVDQKLFYKIHKSKQLLMANWLLPTSMVKILRPLYKKIANRL